MVAERRDLPAPGEWWPDFNEEDKWVANPVTGVPLRRSSGGGTTGTAGAKAVPANITGRSGLASRRLDGRGRAVPMYSARDDLPVAADDIDKDPPWGSVAVVAGVIAGAALAVGAWWGAWKVIEQVWDRRGGGRG